MTAKEIFELRKDGHVRKAYEAARQLFASDKGPYASSAMFWTAVDMLKMHVEEGALNEANRILLALERLLPHVPDKEGWVKGTFEHAKELLENAQNRLPHEKSEHSQLGTWGEEVATDYLRDKGYIILDHDWHSGHRDIDIIARQNDCIVFVEVKTRRNTTFGTPEQAVDYKKQHNLRLAMNHYVKYHRINNPIRFDIITVVGALGTSHPDIHHIEDVSIMG